MATEKTLNARVQCKWDTLENWSKPAAQNLVLKQGEIGFIYIPKDEATNQEAGVLFKVGDGVSNFSALPVGQAAAADVYSWAKQKTKPSYTTSEISGLEEGFEKKGKITIGSTEKTVATKDLTITDSTGTATYKVVTTV